MRKLLLSTALFLAFLLPGRAQMEAMDMGLSVKWATCNLGASKPSEVGFFYAWGETVSKDVYKWSTYAFSRDDEGKRFSKYDADWYRGSVNHGAVLEWDDPLDRTHYVMTEECPPDLEPADDAARALLGGSWRMPTLYDFQELQKACKWKWTKQDGVKGYLATSKETGNSIFFPVTGLWNSYGFDDCPYGFYWSSTLYGLDVSRALNFDMDRHSHSSGTCDRYFGLPIRPVQE